MNADAFRRFLTTSYQGRSGRPLTDKAASDAVSRLRRVERVLGVDLDDELDQKGLESLLETVRRRAGDFRFSGNPDYGVQNHRTACRAYADFRKKRGRS
jgi:hypothetical protein